MCVCNSHFPRTPITSHSLKKDNWRTKWETWSHAETHNVDTHTHTSREQTKTDTNLKWNGNTRACQAINVKEDRSRLQLNTLLEPTLFLSTRLSLGRYILIGDQAVILYELALLNVCCRHLTRLPISPDRALPEDVLSPQRRGDAHVGTSDRHAGRCAGRRSVHSHAADLWASVKGLGGEPCARLHGPAAAAAVCYRGWVKLLFPRAAGSNHVSIVITGFLEHLRVFVMIPSSLYISMQCFVY